MDVIVLAFLSHSCIFMFQKIVYSGISNSPIWSCIKRLINWTIPSNSISKFFPTLTTGSGGQPRALPIALSPSSSFEYY
ncbi:hypothetical protein DERF_014891 [Dermatophagoides farinae]|uniref:Uncharacterized protein n=1 Tax=Dermatophagoides farinae TaxID=6954 RepID=A0A922HJY0_DERFA|nr:hypothetical protein DERF_014891 [Dermatophagoides farinae]